MKKINLEKWRIILISITILLAVLGAVLSNYVFIGLAWIFIGVNTIYSSFLESKDGKHLSMFYFLSGIILIIFGICYIF